jgi:hypothetical protein
MKGIAVLFALGAFSAVPADAQEVGKWECGDADHLIDLQVSRNDVRVNNFNLNEKKAAADMFGLSDIPNLVQVTFTYSVTNRSNDSIHITAQIVGFAADETLVFAMAAKTTNYMDKSFVPKGSTEVANDAIFLAPGDLAKAKKFCVRVDGSF